MQKLLTIDSEEVPRGLRETAIEPKMRYRNGRAKTTLEFLKQKFAEKVPLIPGLLHKRDQVCFTGRRRNGKTQFLMNLALAGAERKEFLGIPIPEPFKTFLCLLEDDAGEVQEKLKRMNINPNENVSWLTRDGFLEARIPINAKDSKFKEFIEDGIREVSPDLIVFDNLAHMIGAKYEDPSTVHDLMGWVYGLCKENNLAVIFAAHPRKLSESNGDFRRLSGNLSTFAEETMGTSHFINSTGSLWGIERDEDSGETIFAGGRQRAEGTSGEYVLLLDEQGWFKPTENIMRQFQAVCNTDKRNKAWLVLPSFPFGFTEGHNYAKRHIASTKAFTEFLKVAVDRGVLLKIDGKYQKNPKLISQGEEIGEVGKVA